LVVGEGGVFLIIPHRTSTVEASLVLIGSQTVRQHDEWSGDEQQNPESEDVRMSGRSSVSGELVLARDVRRKRGQADKEDGDEEAGGDAVDDELLHAVLGENGGEEELRDVQGGGNNSHQESADEEVDLTVSHQLNGTSFNGKVGSSNIGGHRSGVDVAFTDVLEEHDEDDEGDDKCDEIDEELDTHGSLGGELLNRSRVGRGRRGIVVTIISRNTNVGVVVVIVSSGWGRRRTSRRLVVVVAWSSVLGHFFFFFFFFSF